MTIEERLENMEKELARLKWRNRCLLGAILLVAGGLVVPLMFETTALRARAQVAGTVKEIRANKISLCDINDVTRAELTASKDGPGLGLYDEKGIARALLTVLKDGPGLGLYDEKGMPLAKLAVTNGESMLTLCDEKGQARTWLRVAEDGPILVMRDEKGQARTGLSVGKYGPRLLMRDENGKFRFWAGTAVLESPDGKRIEYPESSLILFGPDGKTIWSAIK